MAGGYSGFAEFRWWFWRMWLSLFALLTMVAAVSFLFADSLQVQAMKVPGIAHIPMLVAHRGGAETAPEGSLESFSAAVSEHFAVEMDLRLLSDGNIAISHDSKTGESTTDSSDVAVKSLSTDDWKRLCLVGDQSGCHRATIFDAVLGVVPSDVLMVVENKQNEVTTERLEMILIQQRRVDSTLIESLDFNEIKQAEQDGFHTMYVVHKHQRIDVQSVAEAGTDVLAVSSTYGTSLLRLSHEAGMRLWVWTVDRRFMAIRWARAGVDGIITDYPALMRELLEADYTLVNGVPIPQYSRMSLELAVSWCRRPARQGMIATSHSHATR